MQAFLYKLLATISTSEGKARLRMIRQTSDSLNLMMLLKFVKNKQVQFGIYIMKNIAVV